MASPFFEKSKLVGSFGFRVLGQSCRVSGNPKFRQLERSNSIYGSSRNFLPHGPEMNAAPRQRTRTVQSFYNQSAIDIAAAKVCFL